MQSINKNEVLKLAADPIGFAMQMDNKQLEHVIVTFVSVLIQQEYYRGGKN